MNSVLVPEVHTTGFSFGNCRRNEKLFSDGFKPPKATKTGTTIVGIIFKDGVILGADTRATSGNIVSEKNCEKIHYLAKNMYCCGAGTAADTEMTTQMISSQLELHRLSTNRIVPVPCAATLLKQYLFRYQGHVSAALVLGGVDSQGPHIYSIHPHGSTDRLPYATMGSGSLAAMSVFESRWKPDMTEEDGMKLVRDAIAAGIFNDLGSGSNVDLCIIRKNSCNYLRNYELANKKGERKLDYTYKRGATGVLAVKNIPFDVVAEIATTSGVERMDTN